MEYNKNTISNLATIYLKCYLSILQSGVWSMEADLPPI
jgi:hypothetical protein